MDLLGKTKFISDEWFKIEDYLYDWLLSTFANSFFFSELFIGSRYHFDHDITEKYRLAT